MCFLKKLSFLLFQILIRCDSRETSGHLCKVTCKYPTETSCQLDCSGLGLDSIKPADGIYIGSHINSINFADNKIETLTADCFPNGSQLVIADFPRNRINSIASETFATFKRLQILSLSHNEIWELPINTFDNLTELVKLDLSFNRMITWDSQLWSPLRSLSELSLAHNGISSLRSDSFEDLPLLEKLTLDDNELTILPNDLFAKNTRLKYLSLVGNNFRVVPNAAIASASNLFFLDLSSTKLTTISYPDFRGFTKINTLRIARVPSLISIGEYAFQDMKSLKIFYCDHNNRLSIINDKAFTESTEDTRISLEEFFLRHTSVFTLSPKLLDWHSLRTVRLENNPWVCDCRLKWIFNVSIPDQFKDELTCKAPWLQRGKKLFDVSPDNFTCPYHVFLGFDLLSILLLIIVNCMVGVIACYLCVKLSACKKLKRLSTTTDSNYVRVFAKKDSLDLEWDATF